MSKGKKTRLKNEKKETQWLKDDMSIGISGHKDSTEVKQSFSRIKDIFIDEKFGLICVEVTYSKEPIIMRIEEAIKKYHAAVKMAPRIDFEDAKQFQDIMEVFREKIKEVLRSGGFNEDEIQILLEGPALREKLRQNPGII